MLETLRGCPLSHLQFPDDKDKRFYEWWLERFGVKLIGKRRRSVRIFMQYILPAIIVTLAVTLQVAIGYSPAVSV
jgi:hypothetical protein